MADSKIKDLTSYTTPLNADVLPVVDDANDTTKKVSWANIKATLKTYFDTLYTYTIPVKATGAEINTGTDDAKFATAKAISDSNIAFISDIPVKATGTEVDTGTDDAKFLTSKAVNDSHNIPDVAPSTSGNVLTSNGTDWISALPVGAAVASGSFSQSISTGAFANLFSITSLNGDADGMWELIVEGTSVGSSSKIKMMFNSSDSFTWQRYDSKTDTGTAGIAYLVGSAGGGDSCNHFLINIKIKATKLDGTTRVFYGFASYGNGNNALARINGFWTDTSTNITSIQIAAINDSGTQTFTGKYRLNKIS